MKRIICKILGHKIRIISGIWWARCKRCGKYIKIVGDIKGGNNGATKTLKKEAKI